MSHGVRWLSPSFALWSEVYSVQVPPGGNVRAGPQEGALTMDGLSGPGGNLSIAIDRKESQTLGSKAAACS